MSTYDAVKDLPLEIESYELEPLEREVARGFTLRRTVGRAARRRRGGPRRGGRLRPRRTAGVSRRAAASCRSRAAHTLDSFSAPPVGPDRVPPLGVRVGGARPRAAAGRARRSARRSAASRSRSASSSRRASRTSPGWLELYPELRFKLDPDRDWTDEIVATLAGAGIVDTVDFKGIYRGEFGIAAGPGALRAHRRGVPGRVDRGSGADAGDARARSSRTATGSPGTRRSTSGATSRRCRSARAA